MRYIIYGAGGIGSAMGGLLVRTEHEVILIGRPEHVGVINKRGFHLVTPTGTYNLKIPAVTSPNQIDFTANDVVFLCMKGQDTEQALRDLKTVTADVPVFCFQNGVRNEEIASKIFPRVYGVMVRFGTAYLHNGEVMAYFDPPGWFIIGRHPVGTDKLMEVVAEELRIAGFFVKTSANIMPYKWGKLMVNLWNVVGAITDGDLESSQPIFRPAFEEAMLILEKANIKWISQEQVARDWPEITAPLRGQINTEERPSTWQSLMRRQGSVETEFLNGEIVRVAKNLGLQAPINENLVKIALQMAANRETPGKYTSTQLSEILGLTGKG